MSNSIDVSSVVNSIEELESQAADIESAANDASRAACDAKSECDSAEDAADRAESLADDVQRALGELRESIEDCDDTNEESEEIAALKSNVEMLENELIFERKKFARIVQFITAIADERITLDDVSKPTESDAS